MPQKLLPHITDRHGSSLIVSMLSRCVCAMCKTAALRNLIFDKSRVTLCQCLHSMKMRKHRKAINVQAHSSSEQRIIEGGLNNIFGGVRQIISADIRQ